MSQPIDRQPHGARAKRAPSGPPDAATWKAHVASVRHLTKLRAPGAGHASPRTAAAWEHKVASMRARAAKRGRPTP